MTIQAQADNGRRSFTLVELILIIMAVVILAVIAAPYINDSLVKARDSERLSDATAISGALEGYYRRHGFYPSCSDLTKASATVVSTTLAGLDKGKLTAPFVKSGTNSINCAKVGTNYYTYKIDASGLYTLSYTKESENIQVPIVGTLGK